MSATKLENTIFSFTARKHITNSYDKLFKRPSLDSVYG